MNYRLIIATAMALGLFGCRQQADKPQNIDSEAASGAVNKAVAEAAIVQIQALVSGLNFGGFDTAVRPQDRTRF